MTARPWGALALFLLLTVPVLISLWLADRYTPTITVDDGEW